MTILYSKEVFVLLMLISSKKKQLSLIIVCLMIVQCLMLVQPAGAEQVEPDNDTIKVLTYNINVGVSADTRVLDLDRIADAIEQSGADVIGLQRVDKHYGARSEWKDQAKEIADKLGMYYVFGANIDNNPAQEGEPRRQYGNAILSKYPIVSSDNHLLTRGIEQRGVLSAQIDWNGKTFWFNNTHLAGIANETTIQIPEILAVASTQSGYSVFSGALNHEPNDAVLEPLNETYYDVRTGRLGGETTPALNPTSRTHYIYADRQLEVVDSEVIPSYAAASRPFMAELKVADPDNTVRSLSFSSLSAYWQIGSDYQPTELFVHHADRSISPITSGPAYSSSHPDIAAVNEDGAVRGLSPGTAIITATYKNQTAEMLLNVVERIPGGSADAEEIAVNGVPLENFDPQQLNYEVSLPTDSAVPVISAVPEDSYADVTVSQAAGLPGTGKITIVSEDGESRNTYSIKFKLELPDNYTSVPFRVISYNIHHGVNNANVLDLEAIADIIREHDIDIVGLQEVDKHYSSRSDLKDQAKELAEQLGMYYVYGANLDRDPEEGPERRQYGNAILSKYPIVHWENHLLESFGQEQRGLLEAVIEVEGEQIHFYSTHLGLSEEQRESQAAEVKGIMSSKTGPQLVVGDFNTYPESTAMQILLGDGFVKDSLQYIPEGLTFPSSGATIRADYILYNDDVTLYDAHVPLTEASDHLPVVGQYSIERTTSPQTMEQILERLELEGEFANHGTARSLTAHLETVIRFEQRGELAAAANHMNRFLKQLDTHKQGNRVSDKAYGILYDYANDLLALW